MSADWSSSPKMRIVEKSLPLAELDFTKLGSLALLADNRLSTPITLADRLLKILLLLYYSDRTGLLNLAVKAA